MIINELVLINVVQYLKNGILSSNNIIMNTTHLLYSEPSNSY